MVEEIKKLIEKPIMEKGYILSDVTYGPDNGVNTLTVIIDKEGFINIDDCISVNKIVEPILDEKDPIKESYVLDVCSKEKGSN